MAVGGGGGAERSVADDDEQVGSGPLRELVVRSVVVVAAAAVCGGGAYEEDLADVRRSEPIGFLEGTTCAAPAGVFRPGQSTDSSPLRGPVPRLQSGAGTWRWQSNRCADWCRPERQRGE